MTTLEEIGETLATISTKLDALVSAIAAVPAANDTAVLAAIADLKSEVVKNVEGETVSAPAPTPAPESAPDSAPATAA